MHFADLHSFHHGSKTMRLSTCTFVLCLILEFTACAANTGWGGANESACKKACENNAACQAITIWKDGTCSLVTTGCLSPGRLDLQIPAIMSFIVIVNMQKVKPSFCDCPFSRSHGNQIFFNDAGVNPLVNVNPHARSAVSDQPRVTKIPANTFRPP